MAVIALALAPAEADAGQRGRGRQNRQGIPPGHLPPPGECRVWYEGTPPGRQPPPTDCRTAEARARRDGARVIYGEGRDVPWIDNERGRDDRYEDRDDRARRDGGRRRGPDQQDRGRAVPRSTPYPVEQGPGIYGRRGEEQPAWTTGYRDGLEKGREDTQKNRSYDPHRHQWYRSATRGYNSRYGPKDAYVDAYRRAFTAGYDESFRR